MSETITSDPLSAASEKPVHDSEIAKFPPFPEPTDDAFEEDISEEERDYYKNKFPDLNAIKYEKLHCSACDRHLGCSARNESRMRVHPMLRTLVCHTCHTFYNSGEFDKGEDGSELYCRWCGQGGQVYCCSDCPVVFCAKCIKRNFGMPKIKEIENTDDWKCFKCNSKCLWDLRAVCWALLRYCDLRNKITYQTQDTGLKESYQKACSIDESECCKAKNNKRKEKEARKKEFVTVKPERAAASKATNAINAINAITKIPPTIQVKKFASINIDESPPKEKKAQKRPLESKSGILKTPITVSNRLINPIAMPPPPKKIRMPSVPMQVQPIRLPQKTYQAPFPRIRPKPPGPGLAPLAVLNNYLASPMLMNSLQADNINLSLESLTQGLDMSSVAGMSDQDVVCTPDFPLEPLCEVTEEGVDDDVECMTPGPVAALRPPAPPPLVPRALPGLTDVAADNIIQMTENDVTVNAQTGGLKFRVDPQTLSSNKMYRLPDGRVFAINANPHMPGGYSATIVALSEANSPKPAAKGSTYAAKLSAVTQTPPPAPPPPPRRNRTPVTPPTNSAKRNTHKTSNVSKTPESSSNRICDLKIPVEWYRYNLIDAVDAVEYSLTRLQRLKKEATTLFLRTRTMDEMRNLHKTLDNLLKTSSSRFTEVRENLNKEMKLYMKKKKMSDVDNVSDDDDDDVEILNDVTEDPIFIDENSMESNNGNTTAEVDLTGPASSEHNDSAEKSTDNIENDPLHCDLSNENSLDKNKDQDAKEIDEVHENTQRNDVNDRNDTGDVQTLKKKDEEMNGDMNQSEDITENDTELENKNDETNIDLDDTGMSEKTATNESHQNCSETKENKIEKDIVKEEQVNNINDDNIRGETNDVDTDKQNMQQGDMNEDKNQDTEMTEELIDSLLKDDSESVSMSMDIPEDFPEP